ncbi:kinase-like domain-containing protein [Nemania sp. FL0031]|nr:kinase-like domain-containing protein [Nemania sp. FL0031]
MSGTSTIHDTAELDSPGIHKGWTGEYPAVPTQPEPNSCKWIRRYGVYFRSPPSLPPIFPLKLLKHLLTKESLSLEVNSLEGLDDGEKGRLVEQVLGLGDGGTETYIQVFATLKSMDHLKRLPYFIREGVSDQELPLDDDYYTKSKKPFPEYLLDKGARHAFCSQQYWMFIPFFDYQSGPQDLNWTHVLPYYEIAPTRASMESYRVFGSYGSMSKILIHPHCHALRDAFDALQEPDEPIFFALKRSFTNNQDDFRKEVEMLQRFKSTKHPHIVTLVAAFMNVGNFIIFPWATHNLHMYWRDLRPKPDAGNVELVRWICHQAFMLAEAVSRIHEVPENNEIPEDERSYGRHGDLKPWNILWYKSRQGFGKLVIADIGLANTNRFNNITYIPREHFEQLAKMKYRPPEFDYANDLMGRTVDIWALGCTFFEILLWLNKDYRELVYMETELSAPSIHGSKNCAYYEWVYVQEADFYAVRLKETVMEYIYTLRKDCSQFTQDFLDIIEYQMLIIDHNERISAGKLLQKMKALHSKCIDDQAYCVHKEQRQSPDTPKPKLQKREFGKDLEPLGKDKIPRITLGDDGSYVI